MQLLGDGGVYIWIIFYVLHYYVISVIGPQRTGTGRRVFEGRGAAGVLIRVQWLSLAGQRTLIIIL